MKRYSLLITVIIALLFLMSTAHTTTWYVHPDSTLNSIQAALDSCADNDTVMVGPGIYYENIVWPNTQGIDLISEFGPDTTIIDGNTSDAVMQCGTSIDTTTIIRGFTIRNGFSSGGGGGIICGDCGPIIEGNIITNNSAWDEGGGIVCGGFSFVPIIRDNVITANGVYGDMAVGGGILSWGAIIVGNTITNNEAFSRRGTGGGVACVASIVQNNVISDNNANWSGGGITSVSSTITDNIISGNVTLLGGGIHCPPGSLSVIKHNIITGNTAACGGGIDCWGSSPSIISNTISTNTASCGGGIHCKSSSPTIDSCVISNNTGDGIYCFYISNPIIHYNDINDNIGYALRNTDPSITVNANSNWWGDASGPYHPTLNPGGLGDTVSDYVDFDPWLLDPVFPGIEEQPIVKPVEKHGTFGATIFAGPLLLPEGKKCRVFDITGRVVEPDKIQPGIYFIEVDGVVTQKVVKVR